MRKFSPLFLLVVCLSVGQTGFSKKIYHHTVEGHPNTFDPPLGGNIYSSQVIHSVFETLYTYKYLKRPFELTPYLAEDFPEISEGGRVYKIRIKKGSRYSDNPCFPQGKAREVSAHDIVYNFKRHFDPKTRSTGTWLWRDKIIGVEEWASEGADYKKDIAGIRALDSYTLEFRLTQSFPQFLNTLALSHAAVYPPEAVNHYGVEFGTNPVGSGPFFLKSYRKKKVVLAKNKNFRAMYLDVEQEGYSEKLHGFTGIKKLQGEKIPLLDEVHMNFIEQGSTRWFSFNKKDEIQYQLLSSSLYEEVFSSPEPLEVKAPWKGAFHWAQISSASNNYFEFNLTFPETGYHSDPIQNQKNRALRCAIRKTFEWGRRSENRFNKTGGVIFPGIIPPGIDGFDPGMSRESVNYDPEGASRLLAENGWKPENLPELVFSAVNSVSNTYEFERIRASLGIIGWPKNKISLKSYPGYGALIQDVRKGLVQIQSNVVWHMDYPDAENIFQLFYSPNKSPGVNSSHYSNPEFDRLFEKAAKMAAGSERTQIYKKMNQMLTDECVWISGFAYNFIHTWKKEVIMYPVQGMMGQILKFIDVITPETGAEKTVSLNSREG